jgi:hypothetical protein
MPPGKIVLKSPLDRRIASVRVNGKKSSLGRIRDIVITAMPAKVEITYR